MRNTDDIYMPIVRMTTGDYKKVADGLKRLEIRSLLRYRYATKRLPKIRDNYIAITERKSK